jgi:hypothetical protein
VKEKLFAETQEGWFVPCKRRYMLRQVSHNRNERWQASSSSQNDFVFAEKSPTFSHWSKQKMGKSSEFSAAPSTIFRDETRGQYGPTARPSGLSGHWAQGFGQRR